MTVRNLTAKSDAEFLQESTDAMLAAIAAGNVPMARHWAEHAASFAMSSGVMN